jgi:hypothetical protein
VRKLLSVILCSLLFCGSALAAADLWSLDFTASNVQYLDDGVTGWESSYRAVSSAGWFCFDSISASQAFFGTDHGNQKYVVYWDQANTRLTYLRQDGGATSATGYSTSWTPTPGEWYYIVVTHDQTTVRYYVNDTAYGTSSISNGPRINSAPHFYVGAAYASWDTTDYTWMPFDGKIACLMIIVGDSSTPNYILSTTDATTYYNSGTIDSSGWSGASKIKRLYTMEEGTGATTTSNGYLGGTATLSGVSGTPTWTAFTTPVYATNFSPADEATGQNRAVKLSWTDDATADSHDLWGGTNPASLSQLQNDSTQEWYVVSGLTPGVPYYWRVDQVVGGSTYEGEVLVFTPTGKVGAR